jgi:ADP-ribose pyrophosphatase
MSKSPSDVIIPPIIRTERKYAGKRISVRNDYVDCGLPKLILREVIEHPGAVIILPVTNEKNLLMVHQFRHPINQFTLEFPAGTLESGEEPELCAKRELQEEANVVASEWQSLGILHPMPGLGNEVQYLFFATGLSKKQGQTDPGEVIEQRELSIPEFEALIADGLVTDAKTIATFCRAKIRGLLS